MLEIIIFLKSYYFTVSIKIKIIRNEPHAQNRILQFNIYNVKNINLAIWLFVLSTFKMHYELGTYFCSFYKRLLVNRLIHVNFSSLSEQTKTPPSLTRTYSKINPFEFKGIELHFYIPGTYILVIFIHH